ncbi:MAG: hypothetical protein BGO41_07790 [Clostridiales bacterium 38-18]|nr:MAG: hypothetical protein BGO41_07790 [Clostridiales bacterium 38-18]
MTKKIRKLLIVAFMMMLSLSISMGEVNPLLKGQPSGWAEADINSLAAYDQLRQEAFNSYQTEITRLDFIYLAVRLYENLNQTDITPDTAISFSDTNNIYALKGATIGITSGIGNGSFGPNQLLTREQMATMMMKVLTLSGIELQKSASLFSDDAQISDYAKDSIYKAAKYGVINGYNGAVNPKGNATTEQVLLVYKNMYDAFSALVHQKFNSTDEMNDYLIENYQTIVLNDVKVGFDSYKCIELSDGGLAINATVEKYGLEDYSKAEGISTIQLAVDAKAQADIFKEVFGREVTFSIVYSYYQSAYPADFVDNYIYDESVYYDRNMEKWAIYFPLICVITDEPYYFTYRSSYYY